MATWRAALGWLSHRVGFWLDLGIFFIGFDYFLYCGVRTKKRNISGGRTSPVVWIPLRRLMTLLVFNICFHLLILTAFTYSDFPSVYVYDLVLIAHESRTDTIKSRFSIFCPWHDSLLISRYCFSWQNGNIYEETVTTVDCRQAVLLTYLICRFIITDAERSQMK